jgi:hypothetical protein
MKGRRRAVCTLLAAGAMGGSVAPRTAAAQEADAGAVTGAMTVRQARETLAARARPGGWWVASNAEYREGTQETDFYAMSFRTVPGGLASTGCLWGETDGEVFGPYWHFFAAWDPGEEAVLVYQSSPGGAVAIGHERAGGATVQTIHVPGQAPMRIRHTSDTSDPDLLIDRSFDEVDGAWQPRRQYTWVWTPAEGRKPPC